MSLLVLDLHARKLTDVLGTEEHPYFVSFCCISSIQNTSFVSFRVNLCLKLVFPLHEATRCGLTLTDANYSLD